MVAFSFPPTGWALCNGQLLSISQNTALFSILGTTYVGDGRTNFALPDLQGRVPVQPDNVTVSLGNTGGEESITLTTAQIPSHNHLVASVNQATSAIPAGNVLAAKPRRGIDVFAQPPATVTLASNDVVGSSEPHENRQPYLAVNFIISLFGVFPARN
jgi:microcystin-dependent protein